MSYAWYGIINLLVCVVVGLIVSFVVNLIYHGKNRTEPGHDRDIQKRWNLWFVLGSLWNKKRERFGKDELFDCTKCMPCLSEKGRNIVRCNVEIVDDTDDVQLKYSAKVRNNAKHIS